MIENIINFIKEGVLKHLLFYFISLITLIIFSNSIVYSNEYINTKIKSLNLSGVPGLIDMPTAGPMPDGQLTFSSSKFGSNLRNTISFQALPNINGSFRYSGVGNIGSKFYESSGYTTWDRSFDLRIDVLKESKFLPDVTLGLNDIIGTGIFSGEYLSLSKKTFRGFRSSIGFGWGRYGSRNTILKRDDREIDFGGIGGTLKYKNMFKGDVGLFGGLEYHGINDNLRLKIELSSDNYARESHLKKSLPKSNINYGVDYIIDKNFSLSSSIVNGNKFGLQLNVSANPSNFRAGNFLEESPQPFYSIPLPSKGQNININELSDVLKKNNIEMIAYKLDENTFSIVIENYYYPSEIKAIGRTFRILSRYIPRKYSIFKVINAINSVPLTETSFNRNDLETYIDSPNAELTTLKIANLQNTPPKLFDFKLLNEKKSNLNWSISPFYRVHLFDPNNPLYYDFGPEIHASFRPKAGIIIGGVARSSIVTDFQNIKRGVKGNLPHVRTQLKDYLNQTGPRIRDLTFSSYFKIKKNYLGRITLGYLENMYGGLSSELLRIPKKYPIFLSTELNYVKARDFDQGLGFRELNGLAKTNGHISAYWETGYKYYVSEINYGKYLAGDKGYTFKLTRKYPNGWEIGGFFTRTDASFEDFGEGSFDKGFFIKVPFTGVIPKDTKSYFYEKIRPIQGDGGARVSVPGRIYEIISDKSKFGIEQSWATIWR